MNFWMLNLTPLLYKLYTFSKSKVNGSWIFIDIEFKEQTNCPSLTWNQGVIFLVIELLIVIIIIFSKDSSRAKRSLHMNIYERVFFYLVYAK